MLYRQGGQRRTAQRRSRHVSLPAPVRGWVTEVPEAGGDPLTCRVLENWFPEFTGVRLRGGLRKHVELPTFDGEETTVVSMFSFETGNQSRLYAATKNRIYDATFTTAPTTVEIGGFSNGSFSTQQIATAGGEFMYVLNGGYGAGEGRDNPAIYKGPGVSGSPFGWSIISDTQVVRLGLARDAAFEAALAKGVTVTNGTATATVVQFYAENTFTTDFVAVYVDNVTGGTFSVSDTVTIGAAATTLNTVAVGPADVTLTSSPTLASQGKTLADLTQVWLYRSRLFFVVDGTRSARYLPVDSIGGELAEFSLDAVFQRGGELLFGTSWSVNDAGDGMDDRCVFVSTAGEVAVYQGGNPSDATDWGLVGLYEMPRPMGKHAFQRIGGDVLFITENGLIPLSSVITKDPGALALASVSRPIETAWKSAFSTGFLTSKFLKWDDRSMGLVSSAIPFDDVNRVLAVNMETGAWCEFTGWDAQCWGQRGRDAYMGDTSGTIYRIDEGGDDDGTPYQCSMVYAAADYGRAGGHKEVLSARATWSEQGTPVHRIGARSNYDYAVESVNSGNFKAEALVWDVGAWDLTVWNGVISENSPRWQSINVSGFAISMQIGVLQIGGITPDYELLSLDVMIRDGGVMV